MISPHRSGAWLRARVVGWTLAYSLLPFAAVLLLVCPRLQARALEQLRGA